MLVKVYDKSKNYNEPLFEAPMLKAMAPDGTYSIHVGPIQIVMDAPNKQNLVEEWSLLETLFDEWRSQGKVCDFADEAFLSFLTAGHNRK